MRKFYSFLVISLVMSSFVVQAASPVVASLWDDPASVILRRFATLQGFVLASTAESTRIRD